MIINDIKSAFAAYQFAAGVRKTAAGKTSFAEQLTSTAQAGEARVDSYKEYLKLKYGNVSFRSIPKDQKTLEKVGKSMSGNDVIIAPNIVEQMANDPDKAAYYEKKIDYFFDVVIPRGNALCAARGLVFEPAGVVVHEDGTVTYICGCSDSPERVAEVNAINKAKREKRAAQRKEQFELSQEMAAQRRQLMEEYLDRKTIAEAIYRSALNTSSRYYFVGQEQASEETATMFENVIGMLGSEVTEV